MNHFLIAACIVLLSACGSSDGYKDGDTPPPQDPDPEYAKVATIVATNCGGCHNGTVHPLKLDSGAKLIKAQGRIRNGTMPPPPRKLSDADKAALLAYTGS